MGTIRNVIEQNAPEFFITKNDKEDSSLWQGLKAGDRQALNLIYETYAQALHRYGRAITPKREVVADCIQDLFVGLWTTRASLCDTVYSLRLYLITSLRRTLIRKLHREDRFLYDETELAKVSPAEPSMEIGLIEQEDCRFRACTLERAIAGLSLGQREALHLKFYQGLSYEEISMALNTNVKSVYNLIGKSIASLRRSLKHDFIIR